MARSYLLFIVAVAGIASAFVPGRVSTTYTINNARSVANTPDQRIIQCGNNPRLSNRHHSSQLHLMSKEETSVKDKKSSIVAKGSGAAASMNLSDDANEVYKTSIQRTLGWVGAAAIFGTGLFFVFGSTTSEEFFAGYLLEQSLSVDNLLVFLLLFEYFQIPQKYQNRVLNWGIIGAVIMRAIMIGLGSVALQQFHAVLLGFAAVLLYSSVKILFEGDEEEQDLSDNSIVQFSKKLLKSTDKLDGDRFFTVVNGEKLATPMLLCLIAVEFSDVVFAVDSVPAVFGVTEVRNTSRRPILLRTRIRPFQLKI
jgi:predicted tellurium resistance membrane protein TerC